MNLQALSALLSLAVLVNAASPHHARVAQHKRQAPAAAVAAAGSTSTSVAAPAATTAASGSAAASVPAAGAVTTAAPAAATTLPATGMIPISSITSGMPTQSVLPVSSVGYTPGATPPVSGAPTLPASFTYVASAWPTPDVIAPTDTPEVTEWMKELDGFYIPDLDPTVDDAVCANNSAASADAVARGWWTCAPSIQRPTDITDCPTPLDWGISYDDGPSDYTQVLLDYLGQQNLTATFNVVGSRVVERPEVLIEACEYMKGHEITVHTWSHHYLTTMTNAQVVAELGYARKAIQAVIGVTPTTMRPPYGDIDDRVRAISLAMGLVPSLWTRTPSGEQMDTNDWMVAGGEKTGPESLAAFQYILGNATTMDTGFVVLEHDLFPITVDLSVDYFLPAAQSFTPKLNMKAVGQCNGIPATNLYRETNQNTSFPYSNITVDIQGTGNITEPTTGLSGSSSGSSSSSGSGSSSSSGAAALSVSGIWSVILASLGAMLCLLL